MGVGLAASDYTGNIGRQERSHTGRAMQNGEGTSTWVAVEAETRTKILNLPAAGGVSGPLLSCSAIALRRQMMNPGGASYCYCLVPDPSPHI